MRKIMVVLLLSGLTIRCTLSRHSQLRTGVGDRISTETSIAKLQDPSEQRKVAEASIERHPAFTLGIVEFNDEGLAWSRVQRSAVLAMLREKGNQNGALIVVFVHGWKHNATVCDDNVACFRRVLAGLAQVEATKPQNRRAVIGVYVGWRGLSYCREPARTLSVWSRKRVGEKLGESQGREFLREVLRIYKDFKRDHDDTRLVVAGHSLGAGVVYSAFGPLVTQALNDALDNRTGSQIEPIDHAGDIPLPDLVVLANPAFEAELYKRTQRDLEKMERLHLQFAPGQLPLLLTVSSESDMATHRIFPPAQVVRYALAPFEWTRGLPFLRRSIVTVANFGPYLTDRLEVVKSVRTTEQKKAQSSVAVTVKEKPPTSCFRGDLAATTGVGCDCDELEADPELVLRSSVGCSAPRTDGNNDDVRTCGDVNIVHLRPSLDRRNPFVVASAARAVINGHNDIYNRTFISFLIAFVSDVDQRRAVMDAK